MYYRIKCTECPKCGSAKIGAGYADGYGAVSNIYRIFRSSAIIHEICTDCGYVIASYVKKPEKFKEY